jgi:hypothetical protein
MNETIKWYSINELEPPEEVGLVLFYQGEVFWGDWDGKDFTDSATGLKEPVWFWALVKGPK